MKIKTKSIPKFIRPPNITDFKAGSPFSIIFKYRLIANSKAFIGAYPSLHSCVPICSGSLNH